MVFKSEPAIPRLPAGSFTVDRNGNVMTVTVGSEFSTGLLADVAQQVLQVFREARTAQIPLNALNFNFASLRVTAKEMQGGAIIFLSPQNNFEPTSSPPKKT